MQGDDYVSIPLSKAKLFKLLAIAMLFVALDAYLYLNPDGTRYDPAFVKIMALAGFVIFGLGGAFAFSKLFDDRPGLVLDRNGIIDNSSAAAAGRIAWSDVSDVTVRSVRNHRYLVLAVRNPERYLARGNLLQQRLVHGSYRMTGSPITISSSSLSVGFEELERLVRSFKSRFGTRTYRQ